MKKKTKLQKAQAQISRLKAKLAAANKGKKPKPIVKKGKPLSIQNRDGLGMRTIGITLADKLKRQKQLKGAMHITLQTKTTMIVNGRKRVFHHNQEIGAKQLSDIRKGRDKILFGKSWFASVVSQFDHADIVTEGSAHYIQKLNVNEDLVAEYNVKKDPRARRRLRNRLLQPWGKDKMDVGKIVKVEVVPHFQFKRPRKK